MGEIYQIKDIPQDGLDIISGIYKFNFPNGKCYIGLSNNVKKRVYSHFERDKKRGLLIGNAFSKYGFPTEIEILEMIAPEEREYMAEREKYWIKFYNSNNINFGYNLTEGGEGNCFPGTSNPTAALNEQQLKEVQDLLINSDIEIQEIANKFNVSRSTISYINNGKTYIDSNLSYPLRSKAQCARSFTGTKSSSSKLSENDIEEIYNKILYSDKNLTDIGKEYNISPSTISLINKGKRYHKNNYSYPLRDKNKIKELQYKRKNNL